MSPISGKASTFWNSATDGFLKTFSVVSWVVIFAASWLSYSLLAETCTSSFLLISASFLSIVLFLAKTHTVAAMRWLLDLLASTADPQILIY